MQFVKVTNYIKNGQWGIHLYTKDDKKIKVPHKTVDNFLSENLIKLSNKNILFLRQEAQKKIQTEFYS